MSHFWLQVANYFFYFFHTVLILFNLFGWLHRGTKRLNLISLLVTFGSWFILGIWKGWGYCFLTDWHYVILRKLGEKDLPASYISSLIQKLTTWSPNGKLVEMSTIGLALAALLCSLWVNLRGNKQNPT